MMEDRKLHLYVLGLLTIAIGGCGDFFGPSPSRLFLVGVADNLAYVRYDSEFSGFETLPSVLYEVDLTGGESRPLHEARTQYDVQLASGYYVAERPTEDGNRSTIVATDLAGGQDTVILERNIHLGGRYDRAFAAFGDRVVARTDVGLLVYDLLNKTVEKTIPVDSPIVEMVSARGKWAVATRDNVNRGDHVLIDLETDQSFLIPDPPSGYVASFFGGAIAQDRFFVSAFPLEASDNRVLELDLHSREWKTIASYDTGAVFTPFGIILFVTDADQNHVVASRFDSLAGTRIDLIAQSDGHVSSIAEEAGGLFDGPVTAGLFDGRAIWINLEQDGLVVHDIASATNRTVPLNIP